MISRGRIKQISSLLDGFQTSIMAAQKKAEALAAKEELDSTEINRAVRMMEEAQEIMEMEVSSWLAVAEES